MEGSAVVVLDGPAPLPDGIHPCPTCDRAGCERCAATGRGAYARVYADNAGEGHRHRLLVGLALTDLTLATTAVLTLGSRSAGVTLALAVATVPAAYGLEAA